MSFFKYFLVSIWVLVFASLMMACEMNELLKAFMVVLGCFVAAYFCTKAVFEMVNDGKEEG